MTKRIVIQPVSRIEGHAKVVIELDDAGNVADARVHVIELRGFEQFCLGKPVEEMPRITTRICGVCPWSHHLASAKTTDAVFGATVPPAGEKLRRLCNSIAYMEEHILHFYVLAGPDFVMGPDAEYPVRNVIGMLAAVPDIAKRVIKVRAMCADMLGLVAGKSIHPAAAVPGGFSRPLQPEERDSLIPQAEEALDLAKFTMAFAKESIFPKYLEVVKSIGVITSGFLGTVTDDGALDLYDGKQRMMYSDGSFEEFAAADYEDFIGEHVEPWSYLKFPYNKKRGPFALEDDAPSLYRVNSLARINVADHISTPLAQKELEEFRANFGRPAQLTLLYHWARLIELLHNAELVIDLLNDPEITSTEIRTPVTPRAARGIGFIEAPRGTLFHDYTTDENGLLTHVNLVVATCQNNSAMNLSVKQAAEALIHDGKYDQGTLNTIEMTIRAYDPCLSCATHSIDGKIPVRLDIVGPDGELIDTITHSVYNKASN